MPAIRLRFPWPVASPLAALLALTAALLAVARADADQAPIQVDGRFDDWADVAPAASDPAGDDGFTGHDFLRVSVADTDRFLHLRVELASPLPLAESNDLRLHVDVDDDPDTGLPIEGIGADFEWRFGERVGFFRVGGQTFTVFHDQARLFVAPTVEADAFEIALGRDAFPDGQHPLFPGGSIRFLLRDAAGGGDRIPDEGSVAHLFDVDPIPPVAPLPTQRENVDDLRALTWNVRNDGLWNNDLEDAFRRVLQAIDPDVLALQEIYGHAPSQTRSLVQTWLGGTFHAAGVGDCHVVSRFPILGAWDVQGNAAALVDATARLGAPLLVVSAHLPCCENEAGRQDEADAVVAFLRDAMTPGGDLDLPPDTPVLIAGDLNLVGTARPLETLLTGDILDNATHGPDFAPDWDQSPLADLLARQVERRLTHTWRSFTSTYWPGRLDFALLSDSVAEPGRRFLLDTLEMSPDALAPLGLEATDSLASDHLPLVVDLRLAAPGGPAPLTDADVAFGTLLAGTVDDLRELDGDFLAARSRLGFTAFEPNLMELRVGAHTDHPDPATLSLSIDAGINHPVGTGRARLRNFATGLFEPVGTYPLGFVQETFVFPDLPAGDRVRAADGRIEASLKHVVVATFGAVGFDSFFNLVAVDVR